ncbi:MAG TPA: hypothetical protein VLL98_02310 [Rickettsiales bacterium]|nr:hypothetical protein [Rickettsiales bacterium]
MSILSFRIIISCCLILMICIATIAFLLRRKPILKMVNLGFVYLLSTIFMMYLIIIKQAEDILFPTFIIIFINFLLTFLTGASILGNLLKEDYEDDDYDGSY